MDDPYFTFDLINQIIVLQLTLFKLLFVFLATILENVFLWFNGKETISRMIAHTFYLTFSVNLLYREIKMIRE